MDTGDDDHERRKATGWRPPRPVEGLGRLHNPGTCWGRYADEEAEERQQMARRLFSTLAACSPHGLLGPQALQRLGQWAGFELPSHTTDWAEGGLDPKDEEDNAGLMDFLDSAGGMHFCNDRLRAALNAMGDAGALSPTGTPGEERRFNRDDRPHLGARIPEDTSGRQGEELRVPGRGSRGSDETCAPTMEARDPAGQVTADTRTTCFDVGFPVLLHGLSRVELNGQRGIVVRDTRDEPTDRVPVQLEDSGRKILVKPENMTVRAGADLSRGAREALLAQAVAGLRDV